jgi:hypothetical protein
MRRSLLAIPAALIVFAGSAAAAPSWIVTLDGTAGVVPGMSPAQVAAAWGFPVRAVPALCTVVPIQSGRLRGRAMFRNGKLDAIFFDRGVTTPSGITIGSTADTLQQIYGRKLESMPGSHYFFLTRHTAPHWQLRFDTDKSDRVVQIGFGGPAVQIVAGCA